MHTILFNESFFLCSRDDLERLQPLSQTLLNMIVASSNVLPLRPIHRVDMDSDDSEDSIQIFVAKPVVDEDADEPRPDYKASVHDGDFAETFRRLQHTCIKEFCFGISYSPFLRYWKAQEAAVFTVVSIYSSHTNDADCGVLNSIMNHLRPRVVHIYASASRWHNKGILDRDSFLQNLQICRLSVARDAFPPSSFFLKEPGYPNYDVCCDRSNVADGVDDFTGSFVRIGCANKK
ncbi:hypothetical protein AAVH_30054 [Aphelenchoides avenae]|nr:hypothetical protein AAVH_30054 [Aphelenchus avenae]